ncbi:hypothetical protein BJ165DRAFT_331547 [Panaeolus papilionaceus]|nr:hypothetical protein BJ165DRAFT_331547 [Panaeolus papilionaceus]
MNLPPSHPSTSSSPLPLSPSFILYRTPYSLTWSYSPSNTNTPPLISPCSNTLPHSIISKKKNYRSPSTPDIGEEQVGKGSENMHLWNACGDSVSQTLVANASTLNIDPNSAWLCILSLMHSTNRFMRSRPKRIGELWLSDLWVHYSFCRRSSSCLHHHLYHRHLHNDGHARETLQGRLLVDKWCGEASALEGCREDVVGLVGRDGGLLKMEEREEVVTILGKAFEASGWRV